MRDGRVWPRFVPVGDHALLVEFGDAITVALNQAVVRLDRALMDAKPCGLIETVPSYRSLLIEYEPAIMPLADLIERVQALLRGKAGGRSQAGRHLVVPIAYDDSHDQDLAEASSLLGLEPHALIDAHLAAEYRVYMIGFMPGFAYLGGLPARLHLPRRAVVRPHAPAGSVMIGGMQAAIAALPLRTGWYVIGRTPARGFDKARAEPFLFRSGDTVRFRRIDADGFASLAVQAGLGKSVIEVSQ